MTRSTPTLSRLAVILCLILPNWGVQADDQAQTRDSLRKLRQDSLSALYKVNPGARTEVRGSAGYGVFVTSGPQVLFLGGSGGVGVVRDNLTGRDTYMKMASVTGGIGIGLKDRHLVLIFRTRDQLKQFVEQGGAFGEGSPGEDGKVALTQGIDMYPLTLDGQIAQGKVLGAKFWKDDSLN